MMPPFVVFPTNRIAHFVEVSLYLFYLAQRVKLTIQPLVENSFQHGIRIQEKYGYIQVNVQRENDKIHISVIDNGQGIPDNIIKEMEEGKVPDEKRSLGLRGTVQRLKVIYEDAFSYEIHNEAMSEIHIYINCNVLGEK